MTRVTKEPASRKMRAKHFTPPPELYHNAGENKHLKTPPRTGVLYAKIFGQLLVTYCSLKAMQNYT